MFMLKEVIGNATLYCGDCREVLADIAENSIDAVITDPPYGIAYRTNHRKVMATPEMLANDDDAPVDAVAMMASKIKDGGAMYLATRFDVAQPWVVAMQDAGLTMKTPIFWDKTNHTAGDLEGDYGGQVEIFLFAHQGRHKLRGRRQSNLWRCARPPAGEHPTPKPEGLMKRMVLNSTDKGGTVADFFMGSGTTGVSAVEEGRLFIGAELSRQYFSLSCRRIERAQKQQSLF
jgi:site-specific DNA-methyltransferase (adenine-specific)